MTTPKATIRNRVRAARAPRRAQRAQRDRDPLDQDVSMPRHSPEARGLLTSWTSVLGLMGIPTPADDPGSATLLPALFVPTPTEPDVRAILDHHPQALLPVLVTSEGVALQGPAWALHEGGTSGLVRPAPRWPAQPPALPDGAGLPGPDTLHSATVVLVAALAVDLSGTRLGQGGGWYDRALEHLSPGVRVVAAVLDGEILAAGALPREPHDHPVDAVITPTRALLLDGAGGAGLPR